MKVAQSIRHENGLMGAVELDIQYTKLVPDHQDRYSKSYCSNYTSITPLEFQTFALKQTNDSRVWLLISRLWLILSSSRKAEMFRSWWISVNFTLNDFVHRRTWGWGRLVHLRVEIHNVLEFTLRWRSDEVSKDGINTGAHDGCLGIIPGFS